MNVDCVESVEFELQSARLADSILANAARARLQFAALHGVRSSPESPLSRVSRMSRVSTVIPHRRTPRGFFLVKAKKQRTKKPEKPR